jgi:archaellum component FlaC
MTPSAIITAILGIAGFLITWATLGVSLGKVLGKVQAQAARDDDFELRITKLEEKNEALALLNERVERMKEDVGELKLEVNGLRKEIQHFQVTLLNLMEKKFTAAAGR